MTLAAPIGLLLPSGGASPRRAGHGGPPVARRTLLVATALGPLASRPAGAHALVVESLPATGAALRESPPRVSVRFNSRIDHDRSRLTLIGPEGTAPVALSIAAGSVPTTLDAECPPLAAGAWRLRWQVLAVDGHITRGDIPFSIGPAAAPPR